MLFWHIFFHEKRQGQLRNIIRDSMNDIKLTAIVFGASGLTGRFVVEHLINDIDYGEVRLFVRKELMINNTKIKQIVFDTDKLESFSNELTGDHLFCCLGTTIKKAGSKNNFYRIDHDMVERVAKIASHNKVKSFVVISSIGANRNSHNFYLKTKGQMEESIRTFHFNNLTIIRPSMLLGIRPEYRFGEEIVKKIFSLANPLMIGSLKKYRGIHASTVAKAMISLAKKSVGYKIIESDQLDNLLIEN